MLKERRKNVCGWIEGNFGIIHMGDDKIFSDGVKVGFDPYKSDKFTYNEGKQHLLTANVVYISEKGVFASGERN